MNYELGFINRKYRRWTTILGGFLLCLVYGSITTFSNMSPYIISYLREFNKETDIRYSTAIWISLSNVSTLKIASLLTGFIFTSKFKINLKLYIFAGCFIFRFELSLSKIQN
jgi:hypothetical protein